MEPRKLRDAVADLFGAETVDGKRRGELYELFEAATFDELKDEASDIAWGLGRLVAGMFGKVYFRMPGDRRHYNKVAARMDMYGCARSVRFLVDGKCPNGTRQATAVRYASEQFQRRRNDDS